MNKQEVYNKAKAALLAQGCKSVHNNSCMYRSPDGKKCAVGHLIDDEHYSESLEGLITDSIQVIDALRKSGIDVEVPENYQITNLPDDIDFLYELQGAHDGTGSDFVNEFTARMHKLADKHNLVR